MKTAPKVINNHDYISLVLGKRRLTISWNGTKATGGIPAEVHKLWDDCTYGKKPEARAKIGIVSDEKTALLDVINAFGANIDKIWPDWNKEIVMPKVGDTVKADFGKRRGIDEGVVFEVSKSYVHANFKLNGRVGVHFDMLVK